MYGNVCGRGGLGGDLKCLGCRLSEALALFRE